MRWPKSLRYLACYVLMLEGKRKEEGEEGAEPGYFRFRIGLGGWMPGPAQ